MLTALIDIGSGNLHSAAKAFHRMACEAGAGDVIVTSQAADLARADRIVLPGDGAFAACKGQLDAAPGLSEALCHAVLQRGVPFLGICVGMQLLASRGRENGDTDGLNWIGGEVVKIDARNGALKVPHIGWNDLVIDRAHPVLDGIATGDHAYFVHSYHFELRAPRHRLAHCDYGSQITAIIARDNIVATQFHPEKSQRTGLQLISNFLRWAP